MVGAFREPSDGRSCEPIHSILYIVAQPLERGSNNYYSIIQGVATMCKIMEDMKNEAAKRNSIETARVLLAMGKLSYEEIAQSVRLLTVDEVKALDEGKPA